MSMNPIKLGTTKITQKHTKSRNERGKFGAGDGLVSANYFTCLRIKIRSKPSDNQTTKLNRV